MVTTQSANSEIRALVADDESISRQMIVFALKQEGIHCDVAQDGIEASELLAANSYDVVVTDLQMPRKSGSELVRDLIATHLVPLIIVHTSVIDPVVAKELIAAGVDDIVFKPVDYIAFASKVRALYARRQTQRQFQTAAVPEVIDALDAHNSTPSSARSHLDDVLRSFGLEEHVDQIEHYQLGRLLGAGATGRVFEAEHKLLKRRCAIKFIRPELLSDQLTRDRFTREVRCAAKLSHWNNVNIFDFGLTRNGRFYCVMELLEGCNLQKLLDDHGPLPASRTLHFLAQACDGLEEAHRLGMIHRDLKPSNLMVQLLKNQKETLKILDFGLVLETDDVPHAETLISQSGGLYGTPEYMAPEQITNSSGIDSRADIYSLGATAYALVTGQPPCRSANAVTVVCSHLHDDVVPPAELNPEVSRDLNDIILKCLDKEPDQRFQTIRALANSLRGCNESGRWTDLDAALWWAQSGLSAKTKPSDFFDPQTVITHAVN